MMFFFFPPETKTELINAKTCIERTWWWCGNTVVCTIDSNLFYTWLLRSWIKIILIRNIFSPWSSSGRGEAVTITVQTTRVKQHKPRDINTRHNQQWWCSCLSNSCRLSSSWSHNKNSPLTCWWQSLHLEMISWLLSLLTMGQHTDQQLLTTGQWYTETPCTTAV